MVEKGILTEEEINTALEKRKQQLLEKAKAIKTDNEGNEELASVEESKEMENTAVLKAMSEADTTEG